jgi:hypothetical protein
VTGSYNDVTIILSEHGVSVFVYAAGLGGGVSEPGVIVCSAEQQQVTPPGYQGGGHLKLIYYMGFPMFLYTLKFVCCPTK